MKPVVIVHTNDKQMLGALVSAHSYRRNSRDPDAFEVRILRAEDYPELQARGRTLLRVRTRNAPLGNDRSVTVGLRLPGRWA